MNETQYIKKEIRFPNGNLAQYVKVSADAPVGDILGSLNLEKPRALILIFGGASGLHGSLKPRLMQLFSRGIARAAARTGAMIIDGGTQAGVMELMGQGVADGERKSILLGVAPAGKVTYPDIPAQGSIEGGAPLDPNHSHFVLVDCSEWGCETGTMFEIAKALGKGIPVLAILVNGEKISRDEVLRCVRQGWQLIVIEKSGRLADEIARFWKKKLKSKKGIISIVDPVMAEIIAEGKIQLFPLKGQVEELERIIRRLLPLYSNPTLRMAWESFSQYDLNSMSQQNTFNKWQKWILRLGVLTTLLALSYEQFKGALDPLQNMSLEIAILILPITISILIAATNKFKSGNKWVLLRASAEAIKSDIYSFRARTGIFSNKKTADTSRETKLASRIESISRGIMQTEANLSAMQPYKGQIPPEMYGAAAEDDGFSDLSPDHYLSIRLGDQLNYYRKKTVKLDRQLKYMQWLILIFGGIGTFLAAIGLQLWIALTTTLVGTFTVYLEYQQIENTLMKYNQAATDLANIKAWWTALPPEAKSDHEKIDKLVRNTEQVLQSELAGWVQRMEDALAELHKNNKEVRS